MRETEKAPSLVYIRRASLSHDLSARRAWMTSRSLIVALRGATLGSVLPTASGRVPGRTKSSPVRTVPWCILAVHPIRRVRSLQSVAGSSLLAGADFQLPALTYTPVKEVN